MNYDNVLLIDYDNQTKAKIQKKPLTLILSSHTPTREKRPRGVNSLSTTCCSCCAGVRKKKHRKQTHNAPNDWGRCENPRLDLCRYPAASADMDRG